MSVLTAIEDGVSFQRRYVQERTGARSDPN